MSKLQPILVDKPLGATPLQALALLRVAQQLPARMKLAYAGRLDPMATGLLPVLHGDLLQHQEDFWYLSKRYSATVLIGIHTDSFDMLGMPERLAGDAPDAERITTAIRGLVGKTFLSVPVFSSYRFRENLDEIPVRCMAVSQIDVHGMDVLDHEALNALVCQRISLVQGAFRQTETLDAWQRVLKKPGQWPTVALDIHCASGTYIRSLAHELGRRLGSGAMLLNLRRTHVGAWNVADPTVVRLALSSSNGSWPQ